RGAQKRRYNRPVASYHVQNFGCRATQADGAAIERQFSERGWKRADAAADAEVVVLNTCTVTASADQDARAAIRRVHRDNPKAQILVTGCYAQRAPQELSAIAGVSVVVGNSHKHELANYVRPLVIHQDNDLAGSAGPRVGDMESARPTHPLFSDESDPLGTTKRAASNFVPLARIGTQGSADVIVGDIF